MLSYFELAPKQIHWILNTALQYGVGWPGFASQGGVTTEGSPIQRGYPGPGTPMLTW